MNVDRVILASGSKFRQDLLRSTGLDFEVQTAPINEKDINHSHPESQALARAEAKAKAVSRLSGDALVIGCDQVLSLDDNSYDKAESEEEARTRLREFSGSAHYLHSAYSLVYRGDALVSQCVNVPMKMRDLSEEEITAYVATGEWKGCVGCYQFENRGRLLFDPIQTADQSAIVGLPLGEFNDSFRKLGIEILLEPNGPWDLESARS